eukprot:14147752-Alexandrium_andersonii.AAC.1
MEPFCDIFGTPHRHVRFAPDAKPAALDPSRPKPTGACWWCNHCGTDNQIMKWTRRTCRQMPDWPNLQYQGLEK